MNASRDQGSDLPWALSNAVLTFPSQKNPGKELITGQQPPIVRTLDAQRHHVFEKERSTTIRSLFLGRCLLY